MDPTKPAWIPTPEIIANANISRFMSELDFHDIKDFHRWTVNNYQDFWPKIIDKLGIFFQIQSKQLCDLSHGIESPIWFPGAKLNIADSCFTALSSQTAIIYQDSKHNICEMTYAELDQLSNRVANSLIAQGFTASDAIWIMPYLLGLVAISYLGSFGGQNIIPFGWDFLVIAIFSAGILYLSIRSRAVLTAEEVADYMISKTVAVES